MHTHLIAPYLGLRKGDTISPGSVKQAQTSNEVGRIEAPRSAPVDVLDITAAASSKDIGTCRAAFEEMKDPACLLMVSHVPPSVDSSHPIYICTFLTSRSHGNSVGHCGIGGVHIFFKNNMPHLHPSRTRLGFTYL